MVSGIIEEFRSNKEYQRNLNESQIDICPLAYKKCPGRFDGPSFKNFCNGNYELCIKQHVGEGN